jgi:hypothetical protein
MTYMSFIGKDAGAANYSAYDSFGKTSSSISLPYCMLARKLETFDDSAVAEGSTRYVCPESEGAGKKSCGIGFIRYRNRSRYRDTAEVLPKDKAVRVEAVLTLPLVAHWDLKTARSLRSQVHKVHDQLEILRFPKFLRPWHVLAEPLQPRALCMPTESNFLQRT